VPITRREKVIIHPEEEEENPSPAFDQFLWHMWINFFSLLPSYALEQLSGLENTPVVLSHKKEALYIISSWISVHDPAADCLRAGSSSGLWSTGNACWFRACLCPWHRGKV